MPTYTSPPAYPSTASTSSLYTTDKKDMSTDSKSLSSSSSSLAAPSYTTTPSSSLSTTFLPTQTYQIRTPGKPCSNYHSTTSESEIPITQHPSGIESYRNIRTNKYKGNSTLFITSPHDANIGRQVASTIYKNMAWKHTTIQFFSTSTVEESLMEEVELKSHCLSRSMEFTSTRFGSFTWKYAGRGEKKVFSKQRAEEGREEGKTDNLLVLKRYLKGDKGETVEVARLIRGEGTREEGTNRWNFEGNGGRLEIDSKGLSGGKEVDERECEGLVLATVLVMLKKEVDALSTSQVVAIS